MLEQIPYPVHFVCKDVQRWRELMGDTIPPSVEQVCDKLTSGNDCWTVQTYIQLKRRGLDVHLLPKYARGKICVSHYDGVHIKDLPFMSYVVISRGDRPRPEICEQRIVQNTLNVVDSTDHFMPHWAQPNLQPRNLSRATKIENIIYRGSENNLAEPFKSPEFLRKLQLMGIGFSVSYTNYQALDADWVDYTQADLVLAVRNLTEYDLSLKPASKLVNAWMAGCPALLGPEPAYRELRESELDYIEVRSPEDVVAAIKLLRDEPGLYGRMVENGFRRAKTFSSDVLSLRWRDLLAGSISDGYRRWLKQPSAWKLLGRPAQFARRSLEHKRQRRYFFININKGPRLFPGNAHFSERGPRS